MYPYKVYLHLFPNLALLFFFKKKPTDRKKFYISLSRFTFAKACCVNNLVNLQQRGNLTTVKLRYRVANWWWKSKNFRFDKCTQSQLSEVSDDRKKRKLDKREIALRRLISYVFLFRCRKRSSWLSITFLFVSNMIYIYIHTYTQFLVNYKDFCAQVVLQNVSKVFLMELILFKKY